VVDFSNKTVADDDEYCTYIQHGIRVMQWIERNEAILVKAINEAGN